VTTLLSNARIATMAKTDTAYGLIESAGLVITDGVISWIGELSDLPGEIADQTEQHFDCQNQLITPGLIDCHTHLIYGGDRAGEFEQRLLGTSYADIAKAGGGIQATVNATRNASEASLLTSALKRVDNLCAGGVTTLEIKSGYGLDLETELKMLRVARRIGQERPIQVKTTFLAAHALPIEYKGQANAYIDIICDEMLPAVAESGLADAVDAFCEHIAFSAEQVGRLFSSATKLGLPVKLHAEQLSDQGGAQLAARFGALSADHLEYLSTEGVRAMAENSTAAVLLPGAFYCLNETKKPPVTELRTAGVPIAIASDCNPGSSPIFSLPVILNMACTLFGLTPEESLTGVTRHASKALGLDESIGTLEVGKQADLAIWDVNSPASLSYQLGLQSCIGRFVAGQPTNINWNHLNES